MGRSCFRGYQSQSDILDDFAALTNSAGVLTNDGSGGLTWTAVGSTGTVTSVALSVPTGLSISGSPITSSGTLAISLASGYSIPSTSVQSDWTTAYNERAQWDGGSTNLVASTGRTSLGATTVGSNLFTLTNPSAIRFIRINADNTISVLSNTDFKTALSLTASDVGLSTIAFDVSTLQTRTDSIVDALKDTILLSTALNINLATDTVATKAEVRAVSGGGTVGITLNSGTLTLNGSEGTADDITFYTNGNGSYDLPAGGGNLTIQSQVQSWISDSLDVIRDMIMDSLLLRSEGIFVFGAGGGSPRDTATFSGDGFPILGSFNTGRDTLMITQVIGQLWDINTTDTLAVQIMYADSLNQTSFTTVWSGPMGINSDGLNSTSFASPKIPPRKWVWSRVASVVVGRKPTMINMELFGYRIKAY